MLVTMLGRLPDRSLRRAVIAIPTPDGETLACAPEVAFDIQVGPLLLLGPSTGPGCQGRTFAVDADTGAFTRL